MNPVVAHQIRSAVEARMRELQPIVAELEQLRGVLAMLDESDEERQSSLSAILRGFEHTDRPANVTPIRRAERLGSKRGIDGRAPQGANKQRILAVIAKHPGIAAPQIAKLTGLKRPLVASTVSRLKRTGELQAHGNGVCLSGPANERGPAQASSMWTEMASALDRATVAGA